jgi:hypothetical protein
MDRTPVAFPITPEAANGALARSPAVDEVAGVADRDPQGEVRAAIASQ